MGFFTSSAGLGDYSGLTGLINGDHLTQLANQQFMSYQQYQYLNTISDIQNKVQPNKNNGLLNELRQEIDSWHGNILRAA